MALGAVVLDPFGACFGGTEEEAHCVVANKVIVAWVQDHLVVGVVSPVLAVRHPHHQQLELLVTEPEVS